MNTTQRLKEVEAKKLTPVAFAREREEILCEGLVDLLAGYGHRVQKPRLDSNAEVMISTSDPFGPGLAARLNTVPVRFGVTPSQGFVMEEHQWCRVGHFALERLPRNQDLQKS